MGAWRDLRGDFGQMQVHRLGIAAGHDEPRALAVLRADRAEDVGEAVRWSFGALGRDPRLAHLRVILFFWPMRASSANQTSMRSASTPASRPISSGRATGARGDFFKILDRAGRLRMMARTGRQLAIIQGAQFAAHRLLGHDDPKFLPNPLAKIDDPPSHDAMRRRDRTALDDRRQGGALFVVQARRRSRRLAIDQALGAVRIELQHPVADDLQRHPADLRRLGPRRAFVDRRQRQQPPSLRPVLRTPRRLTIAASKSGRSAIGMANPRCSPP